SWTAADFERSHGTRVRARSETFQLRFDSADRVCCRGFECRIVLLASPERDVVPRILFSPRVPVRAHLFDYGISHLLCRADFQSASSASRYAPPGRLKIGRRI